MGEVSTVADEPGGPVPQSACKRLDKADKEEKVTTCERSLHCEKELGTTVSFRFINSAELVFLHRSHVSGLTLATLLDYTSKSKAIWIVFKEI